MTDISTTCAEVIIEIKVSGALSVDGKDCHRNDIQKNRKWNFYYATISIKPPLPPFGLIMITKRVILPYVWIFQKKYEETYTSR